jgi:hypothetical protein
MLVPEPICATGLHGIVRVYMLSLACVCNIFFSNGQSCLDLMLKNFNYVANSRKYNREHSLTDWPKSDSAAGHRQALVKAGAM